MLAPVLEAVSGELGDQVRFYSVDVDECPALAAAYRVQSVPCLVLLKKGVLTVNVPAKSIIVLTIKE